MIQRNSTFKILNENSLTLINMFILEIDGMYSTTQKNLMIVISFLKQIIKDRAKHCFKNDFLDLLDTYA